MMIFQAGLALGMLALPIIAASAQEGVTLTMGRLIYSAGYLEQTFSVKNDTTNRIRTVQVECGFFYHNQLIAVDTAYIENIGPNITGFGRILAASDIRAERAECRIVTVRECLL